MQRNDAEEAFLREWLVRAPTLPPEREFRFHPERRWRFDFAWPSIKLAVEIEGRGRHQTVVGYRRDCEKYNEAARLGWRVLRFPATDWKRSPNRKEWPFGANDWAEWVQVVMCNAT